MVLDLIPFRYYSRPEILDLTPFISYSHFYFRYYSITLDIIQYVFNPLPRYTLLGIYPPTRKHILFLNKNILQIRKYYMNVNT